MSCSPPRGPTAPLPPHPTGCIQHPPPVRCSSGGLRHRPGRGQSNAHSPGAANLEARMTPGPRSFRVGVTLTRCNRVTAGQGAAWGHRRLAELWSPPSHLPGGVCWAGTPRATIPQPRRLCMGGARSPAHLLLSLHPPSATGGKTLPELPQSPRFPELMIKISPVLEALAPRLWRAAQGCSPSAGADHSPSHQHRCHINVGMGFPAPAFRQEEGNQPRHEGSARPAAAFGRCTC